MNPTNCVLTGFPLKGATFSEATGPFLEYIFPPVGKVKVALPTLMEWRATAQYTHPVLAGICRNAFEHGQEPPMIDANFLSEGIRNVEYPKTFKERVRHTLKFMYSKGAKDFKPIGYTSVRDYPIAYANDHAEFNRIMDYLRDNYFIKWKNDQILAGGIRMYYEVLLTNEGIEEVEKELPKVPLASLVDQKISSGNVDIDEQINHAKDLFFREPVSMEKMRSACETLSYVLEPLKKDLDGYFLQKDVSDFFQMVNTFDVRHNKEHTKNLVHPEQLEWIFYSLLNTITTYVKLKKRLGGR